MLQQISLLEGLLYFYQGEIPAAQLLQYLTTILMLLLLIYPISKHIFDLHFMWFTIFWISTWLVIVYPQKLFVTGRDGTTTYYLTDFDMIYVHVISHVIPFILVMYLSSGSPHSGLTNKTLFSILFIVSYLLIADVKKLYGVKKDVMVVIGSIALLGALSYILLL